MVRRLIEKVVRLAGRPEWRRLKTLKKQVILPNVFLPFGVVISAFFLDGESWVRAGVKFYMTQGRGLN